MCNVRVYEGESYPLFSMGNGRMLELTYADSNMPGGYVKEPPNTATRVDRHAQLNEREGVLGMCFDITTG